MGRFSRITGMGLISLLTVGYFSEMITVVKSSSLEKDLTLTYNQKVTLDKFKQRVTDRLPHEYMKQDIYLIRWLRARDFNIDQAEKMLYENLKWRKTNRMDSILQEDWTDFFEKFPYTLDTYGKNGSPLLTAEFGQWDLRSVSIAGMMPRIVRYLARGMEEATTLVRKLQEQGKNVTQFDFLVNMDHYNVVQHGCLQCVTFYLGLINSYENYYPGFCNNIALFNTPPVFEVILRVVRPLMSPITRRTVHVYGQDKKIWTKALLEIADKNQLTPEFGGTLKRQE